MERGFQRLRGDASVTISGVIANSIMALVVGMAFMRLDHPLSVAYL